MCGPCMNYHGPCRVHRCMDCTCPCTPCVFLLSSTCVDHTKCGPIDHVMHHECTGRVFYRLGLQACVPGSTMAGFSRARARDIIQHPCGIHLIMVIRLITNYHDWRTNLTHFSMYCLTLGN